MRASPEGEVPLHRALTYPVSDLALHSWDVLLEFCRELVASAPEDRLRRPGGFGPARATPEGSTPTARLMAHSGRSA